MSISKIGSDGLNQAADTILCADSGNVGIGTSPAHKLDISGTAYGGVYIKSTSTNFFGMLIENTNSATKWQVGVEGGTYIGAGTFNIGISGVGSKLAIDSSGNLLVGKTVSTSTVNGFALTSGGTLYVTSNGDTAEFYRKTSSSGDGVFLTKSDVGGTHNLVGAAYANGTFAAVSDATKKKNVEDARSYLNDVMQVRVVKYNWITDEDETPKELGWVAQEVEQVFPGMVNEMGGSKLLKKEVFLPMLMKCVQELKAINDAQAQTIESLTARVSALEAS